MTEPVPIRTRRPSCSCATAPRTLTCGCSPGWTRWSSRQAPPSSRAAESIPRIPGCRGRVGHRTVSPARLGCDALVARALIGAAVRETFEEAGVLLTDPPAGVPDVSTLAADVGGRTYSVW